MSFQVPVISSPLITINAAVERSEDFSSLRVGQVVQVQASADPETGQRGVILFGKRLNAEIPATISDGQKLQVQVTQNSPNLVLKVIPAPLVPVPDLNFPVGLFKELEKLFNSQNFDQLRNNLPAAFKNFDPTTEEDSSNPKQAPAQLNLNQSDKQLQELLSKSILNKNIDLGQALKDNKINENFLRSLLNLGQQQLLSNLEQAKIALQNLVQTNFSDSQIKFLKTISPEIKDFIELEKLLNQVSGEDQDAPDFKQLLKDFKGVGVLFGQNIIKLTNNFENEIDPKDLTKQFAKIFLKQLSNLEIEPESNIPADQDFKAIIADLKTLLRQHSKQENQPTDTKERPTLKKLQDKLEQIFLNKTKLDQSQMNSQQAQSIQSLEKIIQSQDVLNKLNPVMQALGEPALVLFPMIISGLVSGMRLSLDTQNFKRVEPDANGKNKAPGNDNTFQRLHLNVPLAGLGAVEIDLAYNSKEVMLNMTFENESATTFINDKITNLSQRLNQIGYEKNSLKVQTGHVHDISPKWFQELIRKDGVMA